MALLCTLLPSRLALSSSVRAAAANAAATHRRRLSSTPALRETFRVQDEEDFKDKVMKSAEPVIVDFTATWCGPCKILGPRYGAAGESWSDESSFCFFCRLDAAVTATEGKVHLALVDIDDLSDLALDHGVQAVPTVLGVKDGKVVDKFVGLVEEDKLEAFVNKLKG